MAHRGAIDRLRADLVQIDAALRLFDRRLALAI
jgi:hypothetical protein